ncbi:uncharacterized protein MONBRDRAFT_9396 [Monosiga brevicollis MX1]|uniref:J domain-containing protein n=1 Tax=Monosiga brevicollis TaxID=81824 RepID=A9V308_MONBE|nr:uncharacterized protein MONBRDRAFT_9396 [Monosiga brevicollis MX1]EDQ88104.1 predicted protein [Monosiga brevicollis MX1]|eukprot:XP_001747180.1 hypothetical protein [Monosiga brevicollis MX1]
MASIEAPRKRPQLPALRPIQRVKLLTLGDAGVGKSCLIKRYCERRFVSKYIPTVGLDYGVAPVQRTDADLRVSLYDLSGDRAYEQVRCEFYDAPQGVLLLFDVTKRATFDSLVHEWLTELRHNAPSSELAQAVVAIVGHQNDREQARQVPAGEAQMWAEQQGYRYFETSAASGQGVQELFSWLIEAVYQQVYHGRTEQVTATFSAEDLQQVDTVLRAPKNDDYAVLQLLPDAQRAEVMRAYKTLAAMVHPDKNRAPGSEEAFKRIASARSRLLAKDSTSGMPLA